MFSLKVAISLSIRPGSIRRFSFLINCLSTACVIKSFMIFSSTRCRLALPILLLALSSILSSSRRRIFSPFTVAITSLGSVVGALSDGVTSSAYEFLPIFSLARSSCSLFNACCSKFISPPPLPAPMIPPCGFGVLSPQPFINKPKKLIEISVIKSLVFITFPTADFKNICNP